MDLSTTEHSPQHTPQHEKPGANHREQRFVTAIFECCQKDKGVAARLRRADNPATEYQSWEFLAAYGIDLEKDRERVAFVTVAAAIAKSGRESNGQTPLGKALANSYSDKQGSDQGKAKLRRLLACNDLEELARHLRAVLALIHSKNSQTLDYERLLSQLRRFSWYPQHIKAQWAQEFYRQTQGQGETEAPS